MLSRTSQLLGPGRVRWRYFLAATRSLEVYSEPDGHDIVLPGTSIPTAAAVFFTVRYLRSTAHRLPVDPMSCSRHIGPMPSHPARCVNTSTIRSEASAVGTPQQSAFTLCTSTSTVRGSAKGQECSGR